MKFKLLGALALTATLAACTSSSSNDGSQPGKPGPKNKPPAPSKPAAPDVESVTLKQPDCTKDCVTSFSGATRGEGKYYRFGDKWSAVVGDAGKRLFVWSHPNVDTWHEFTTAYDFVTGNATDLHDNSYGISDSGQMLHDESAMVRTIYGGLLETDLTNGLVTIHKFGDKASFDLRNRQLAISKNDKTVVLLDKTSLFVVDRIAHKVSYRLTLTKDQLFNPLTTTSLWYKNYTDTVQLNNTVVSENGRFVAVIIKKHNADDTYDFTVRVWDALEEKSWEISLFTHADVFNYPYPWGVTPDGHLLWASRAGKWDSAPIGLNVTRLSDGTLVNTISKNIGNAGADFDGDHHILLKSRMINVMNETLDSVPELCTGGCAYSMEVKWSDDRKTAIALGNGKVSVFDKRRNLIRSLDLPKEIDWESTIQYPLTIASSNGNDLMVWRRLILKRGADFINLQTGAVKHFDYQDPRDSSVRDYVNLMRVMPGLKKVALWHSLGMMFYDLP